MVRISTILYLILFSTTTFYAQSSHEGYQKVNQESFDQVDELAPVGTFYLVPKDKRIEVFTNQKLLEIRSIVESNRQKNQRVTLSVSHLSDVVILSMNEIKAPSFVPIEGLYID